MWENQQEGMPSMQRTKGMGPQVRSGLFSPSHLLEKDLGADGIEGSAGTTSAHDVRSLFGGQPPKLHVVDHLSDKIE